MDAPYATHANNNHNEDELFLDTATSHIVETAIETGANAKELQFRVQIKVNTGGTLILPYSDFFFLNHHILKSINIEQNTLNLHTDSTVLKKKTSWTLASDKCQKISAKPTLGYTAPDPHTHTMEYTVVDM